MQETSETYRRLRSDNNSWFETSVVVGESGNLITKQGERILFGGTGIIVARDSPDTGFGESIVKSVKTYISVLDREPAIGKVVKQQIDVVLLNPSGSLPRMAQVVPYVRVCTPTEHSEWLKQGEFFIDWREVTKNDDGLDVLTLHGFDALAKAEQDYDSTNLNFPAKDIDIVREIAGKLGIQVDSRTVTLMNAQYRLPLPTGYSLGEYLSFIASMYVGNFIITEQGALRLVSYTELPEETRYLVDNAGYVLVFGSDRILV